MWIARNFRESKFFLQILANIQTLTMTENLRLMWQVLFV